MTAEIGDVYQYANGNEYVITDGGPVVMATCARCGAAAGTTFDYRASNVRCSKCLSEKYELLAGQRIYELKAQYAREHAPPRWKRQ